VPEPGEPSIFEHELATGTVVVASDQGMIMGFGAMLDRGDVGYLAELFVAPDTSRRASDTNSSLRSCGTGADLSAR